MWEGRLQFVPSSFSLKAHDDSLGTEHRRRPSFVLRDAWLLNEARHPQTQMGRGCAGTIRPVSRLNSLGAVVGSCPFPPTHMLWTKARGGPFSCESSSGSRDGTCPHTRPPHSPEHWLLLHLTSCLSGFLVSNHSLFPPSPRLTASSGVATSARSRSTDIWHALFPFPWELNPLEPSCVQQTRGHS